MSKVINSSRSDVVNSISRDAAVFIMEACINEAPDVTEAIECSHDVIRHLAKKLNVEVK